MCCNLRKLQCLSKPDSRCYHEEVGDRILAQVHHVVSATIVRRVVAESTDNWSYHFIPKIYTAPLQEFCSQWKSSGVKEMWMLCGSGKQRAVHKACSIESNCIDATWRFWCHPAQWQDWQQTAEVFLMKTWNAIPYSWWFPIKPESQEKGRGL